MPAQASRKAARLQVSSRRPVSTAPNTNAPSPALLLAAAFFLCAPLVGRESCSLPLKSERPIRFPPSLSYHHFSLPRSLSIRLSTCLHPPSNHLTLCWVPLSREGISFPLLILRDLSSLVVVPPSPIAVSTIWLAPYPFATRATPGASVASHLYLRCCCQLARSSQYTSVAIISSRQSKAAFSIQIHSRNNRTVARLASRFGAADLDRQAVTSQYPSSANILHRPTTAFALSSFLRP
ncbi:hypothetical protein BGW36DRAFT_431311 [Talaromyces proteolyticus]|uniref:Uncharacterized protein n=1 Tax=Talaromyces proteolyticus TaxID=1131652 RepID=A0AAD4KIU8_9EURO|nr:uncharacterized protein BGW36DRAFT_431311 [Talaromyces proteolyticus]KAH8692079.1 hypothetical protein BGW36DRAFT_431311 [Talaromyces proteolyticus]